jgi:hypothetical protein
MSVKKYSNSYKVGIGISPHEGDVLIISIDTRGVLIDKVVNQRLNRLV